MIELTHYDLNRLIALLDQDIAAYKQAQQHTAGGMARLAGMRCESSRNIRNALAAAISKDVKRIKIKR